MSTETTAAESNPIDALHHEAKTDIGLRREENQDSFGVVETASFRSYIVADGMGGVKGGAIASSLAIDVIREQLKDRQSIDERAVAEAVTLANAAIFEKGTTDTSLTGMGTTVVMLTFTGTKLLIANVGDSRAYRIRGGLLDQLTEDHTLVNELVRAGTITEEQAASHPVSHMLTRSLGPAPAVEVDSFECLDEPHRGDVYLLCSDGLYNMVHPEEFVEVVQSLPVEEVAAELISLANLRGGADNITVILIKIGDEFPLPKHEAKPDEETFVLEDADLEQAGNAKVASNLDLEKLRAAQAKEKEQGDPSGDAKPGESRAADTSVKTPESGSSREEPKVESTQEDAVRPRRSMLRYALLIVAASACITVAYSLGRMNNEPPKVVVKNEIPLVVAPPPSSETTSVAPPVSSVSSPDAAGQSSSAASAQAQPQPTESVAQRPPSSASSQPIEAAASSPSPAITADRREILNAQIANLQEKISAFDKPISGKLAENLGISLAKIGEMEKKEGVLTSKLQEATSRLSKWLGLKRRLEEQNPIDLAGEVSELSPAVKAKQDEFQRVTWAYLQEYEAWQKSNNNSELDKKVQQLAQGRSEAMAALGDTIKSVVEEEISKTDKIVGDVTFERDAIGGQIRALRQEVAFARTLVGGDAQARELMKNELKVDLQRAQTELKHLEILSPPPPVAEPTAEPAPSQPQASAPAA